ncbi:MAG TPA: hypothetical protein HPP94_06665 [Desulfuromonadales bacterium]|nr:hypothetical protein [Desulfuromonadales bacterium]
MQPGLLRYLQGSVGVIIFMALWHLASTTGLFGRIDPEYSLLLLPTPETVLKAMLKPPATEHSGEIHRSA